MIFILLRKAFVLSRHRKAWF